MSPPSFDEILRGNFFGNLYAHFLTWRRDQLEAIDDQISLEQEFALRTKHVLLPQLDVFNAKPGH